MWCTSTFWIESNLWEIISGSLLGKKKLLAGYLTVNQAMWFWEASKKLGGPSWDFPQAGSERSTATVTSCQWDGVWATSFSVPPLWMVVLAGASTWLRFCAHSTHATQKSQGRPRGLPRAMWSHTVIDPSAMEWAFHQTTVPGVTNFCYRCNCSVVLWKQTLCNSVE